MNLRLVTLSSLCLLGAVSAQTVFPITAEIREKLQSHPATKELISTANGFLKAEPLDPEKLAPSGRNLSHSASVICHTVGRNLTNWMEALGWAWTLTNDAKYSDKGISLLLTMVERFPVEQHWMSGPGTMAGGRGDTMRGLAMGYAFFSPQMTKAQRDAVAACAKGYLDHFLTEAESDKTWWKNVHNFNGVCGGAAGLLTIAFADYPEIVAQQNRIIAVLERWFDNSVDDDGAYAEGAGYCKYGFSNCLLFAWLLREHGGKDLFKHPHIAKLPQFFAASTLPGTTLMDARNDCGYDSVGFETMLIAVHNKDSLAAYLWNAAGRPGFPWSILLEGKLPAMTPPEKVLPHDVRFRDRGLCVWRTGWSDKDVMFSTEAGKYYHVTHNQSDKGHFTLYAYGERWAIDAGYGNDNKFEDSRCHTLAHNCVLIDGGGQAISGCGTGTNGKILAFDPSSATTPGYALADATEAYQRNYYNKPGVGARQALRHNLFIQPFDSAPAYAAVFDDIEKDDDIHDFTWQMLTWTDKEFVPRQNGALIRTISPTLSKQYAITPLNAPSGMLEWTFTTTAAAEWRLFAETAAKGEILNKSDSFCVQIDDLPVQHYHMPTSSVWQWGEVSNGAIDKKPFRPTLAAGKHTLRVMTREPEAAISAVILTRSADAKANFLSLKMLSKFTFTVDAAAMSGGMQKRALETEQTPKSTMLLAVNATVPMETPSVDIYAPQDGRQPQAMPRIRFHANAVNPYFGALLIPLPPNTAEPKITAKHLAGNVLEYTIQWPSHTDTIRWNGMSKPQFTR